MKGLILKSVAGFYYVETENGEIIECKARGSFRANGISPKVGDTVLFSISTEGKGVIEEIAIRKNELTRPPVANIDKLFIVVSTVEPIPNFLQIDELVVSAEYVGIEPVIVVSKTDKTLNDDIFKIYSLAGFSVYNAITDFEEILNSMKGNISAVAGNSGVGKSTLLNRLGLQTKIETGEISKKLGRGRHTTRVVELHKLSEGGYIADTPGFTVAQTERYVSFYKDELEDCFREFSDYKIKCKFLGCSHTGEKGCAVKEAVDKGEISESRYKSYNEIYNRIKNIPKWQIKNGGNL